MCSSTAVRSPDGASVGLAFQLWVALALQMALCGHTGGGGKPQNHGQGVALFRWLCELQVAFHQTKPCAKAGTRHWIMMNKWGFSSGHAVGCPRECPLLSLEPAIVNT